MITFAAQTTPGNATLRPCNPALEAPGPAPEWTQLMTDGEWEVYLSAIQVLRKTAIPFMLGGAFGLAAYTRRWRNTKDIDFFLLPEDRNEAVQALCEAGFEDFYPTLAYDRGWIYRSTKHGLIVDLIWATPNRRTQVTSDWLQRAGRLLLRSQEVQVIPAEDLLWIKLYVLQRDRCDWPDLINLLYATSSTLDWEYLQARLENDLPLLIGLLSVFAWLCPDRVGDIPARLRKLAGIRKPRKSAPAPDQPRIDLLDSRPWFAALQPCTKPMWG